MLPSELDAAEDLQGGAFQHVMVLRVSDFALFAAVMTVGQSCDVRFLIYYLQQPAGSKVSMPWRTSAGSRPGCRGKRCLANSMQRAPFHRRAPEAEAKPTSHQPPHAGVPWFQAPSGTWQSPWLRRCDAKGAISLKATSFARETAIMRPSLAAPCPQSLASKSHSLHDLNFIRPGFLLVFEFSRSYATTCYT